MLPNWELNSEHERGRNRSFYVVDTGEDCYDTANAGKLLPRLDAAGLNPAGVSDSLTKHAHRGRGGVARSGSFAYPYTVTILPGPGWLT